MSVFRRRACGDDGAAAVEFALLLPLFLMLCFGSISGGILFNDKLSLTQGVREAARYGATLPYNADPTTYLRAVYATAQGDTTGEIGSGSKIFCVGFKQANGDTYTLSTAGGTAAPGMCAAAPGTLKPLSVVVVGYKNSSLELIVKRHVIQLASLSVARYEGKA